jgi:aldehyde:ferredoxin oxidoreductase
LHGYGGKLLYVDLSSGKITKHELEDEFAGKYIGGNGFGARLLYDNTNPRVDALGAENCLILAPGSFCGSPVPEAAKSGVYAKSPLTGAFGESMLGAAIGPELKYAGYDVLVVKGRASKWSYLWVDDDEITVRDAASMVGQTTFETIDGVCKDLGEREAIVASIGPAGESLVKFANIECEYREAGRTGMGAVMGSKRRKAIAIRGTKGVEPADPQLMEELIAQWYERIGSHPSTIADVKYGTGEFIGTINEVHGVFPTRNWQDSVFEGYGKLAPQKWVPKYSIRNEACFSCIKPCGKVFVVKEGKYAGTIVDGPEYETLFSLGALVGNSDIEAIAKANKLCDDLGMDTISAGAAVAWAMECYERGLLSRQDVGGLDLKFGNAEAVLELLRMIASREGIGDILAEGTREASRRLGKGSSDFTIHVKGMEPAAYDMRGMKGYALACAVSTRGACHLRACAYSPELSGSWWMFRNIDRLSTKNKAYVKILEDIMTLYDMTGICKFTRYIYFADDLTDFFKAVHGYEPDVRELIKSGERVYNLEKAFNIREGFTRRDDILPPRVMKEPIRDGPSRGQLVNKEDLNHMLDDYYRIRGWDSNGVPTREKLEELGLLDLTDDLGVR